MLLGLLHDTRACHPLAQDVPPGRRPPHRIEVLYSDGMDARLSADGRITELRDASTDDLLRAVDAAGERSGGESPG